MGKPVRDEEELRLLSIAEACRAEEIAAADALIHPTQSLVYSEYQRLLEALKAVRLKHHKSRIALRVYRHKMPLE